MGDISEYDTPSVSVPSPAEVKAGTTDVASAPGAHPIDDYSVPATSTEKAGAAGAVETPKPPPDYANMPVKDVALGAAKAFIPDAASIVPEVVGGIGSAIKHTYDTKELPGKGLVEGADAWVNKKLSGYAPETMKMINKAIGYTPPTDAEYEAKVKPATDAASALYHDTVDPFTSYAKFAEAATTKPAHLALNTASVAMPALRVARTGAEMAGLASKAGTAADLTKVTSAGELGQAVHGAMADAAAARDTAYTKAFSHTATFDPAAAKPIMSEVQANLNNTPNFPGLNRFDKNPHLADAKAAYDHLESSLNTMHPNDFTMSNMENIRRDLQQTAMTTESGPARYMIGQMIDGIDSGISKVATKPGMYGGDGVAVASDMAKARKLNVDYIQRFGSEAPAALKPSLNVLPKDLSTADDSHFHAVGTGVGNALMNDSKGGVLYNHLSQFVPKDVLDSYMRTPMLAGKSEDVLKRLNTPVAQNVFGSELDRAKKLAASQNTKTLAGKVAPYAKSAGRVIMPAIGHAIAPGFGGVLAGGATEFVGEQLAKRMLPHGAGRAPLIERFAGKEPPVLPTKAEAVRRAVNPLTWVRPSTYTPLLNPSTYKGGRLPAAAVAAHRPPVGGAPIAAAAAAPAPVPTEAEARVNPLAGMSYGFDPTGQNRYASGGAVKGHQHLVDRLFAASERARREEKAHTSSILHQPDEAVAKALNIAQAAI